MAATEITPTVLGFNTAAAMPATVAVDAVDGAYIDCAGIADQKLLIIMENSDAVNAEDVTIVKGNGIQGVNDLVNEVAASSTEIITVESGLYKQVSGDDMGKILIEGTADVKIAAVVLP